MPHALASALTFALIPAGVALLGAVVATFRTPSPQIRTYVQHFAAGVVMAVAAAELLPASLKGKFVIAIVIGFGLRTIAMLLIAHLSERAEGDEEGAAPAHGTLAGRCDRIRASRPPLSRYGSAAGGGP